MQAHLTRFMERCVSLAKEVVVGSPAPAVRRGAGGFDDWLILAVQCLRERETETYRSVIDKLKIMGPIRDVLGLERDELPHPSTVCKAMDRLSMALCRRLLQRTTILQELGDVTAIDASSLDRIAASRRYARRTDYRLLAMKTTLLVDCQSSTVLDLHCSASRPHDTQIGWQVLTRNLGRIRTITADKGFDWADLRDDVHNLRHHFMWCPKYRKTVLTGDVTDRLESLIGERADNLELEILELAIQPDHVHLFITGHPKLAPNKIIQQRKGYSSRVLRDEYDFGLPSLWSRSYFVFSAGEASSQTIEEYIEAQTGQ